MPSAKKTSKSKPAARKPKPRPATARYSPAIAVQTAVSEAWDNYRRDHAAALRGMQSASTFLVNVQGAVIDLVLNDAELAAIVREGRIVERDTQFWTRVVDLAGDLIPQLITRFVP